MFKFGLGFNLGTVAGSAGVITPPIIVTKSIYDRENEIDMTSTGDASANTLGVVFRTAVSGYVTKLWFWKTSLDTATTRTVGIYDLFSQTLLGSGTSSGEPAGPAWISVDLSTPVRINPTTRYIAAVLFPNGHYATQAGGFTTSVTNSFIEAMSDTDPLVGSGNGRYNAGASLAFPASNFNAPNYWVDIGFEYAKWPDATNTGVPTGTVLTPVTADVNITTPDTIYENMHVTGSITVNANNVTIRNCKITSTTPFHVLRVQTGANFQMFDSEIDGLGTSGNGVYGYGSFRRVNIHGVENGINLIAPGDIRDCYIHSFGNSSTVTPHFDGIESNGGGDHSIIHNTILLNESQTTPVMINNQFSAVSNIEVAYNYLSGGSYTLYVDASKSDSFEVLEDTINIHANRMGIGDFGYFALNPGVWGSPIPSENYDAITGDEFP